MYSIYVNGQHYTDSHDKEVKIKDLPVGENIVEVVEKGSGERQSKAVVIPPKKQSSEVIQEVTTKDLERFKGKAGWYTFEDGHKVRGEDAALEYLKSL